MNKEFQSKMSGSIIDSILITSVNSDMHMEDDQVIYVQSIHDFEEDGEEEEQTASDTFSIERDLFGFDENDHENSVSSSKSLKHQFLLNTALETMNHGIQPKMATNVVPKILKDDPEAHSRSEKAHAKMYQGLICVMENFRFYGKSQFYIKDGTNA